MQLTRRYINVISFINANVSLTRANNMTSLCSWLTNMNDFICNCSKFWIAIKMAFEPFAVNYVLGSVLNCDFIAGFFMNFVFFLIKKTSYLWIYYTSFLRYNAIYKNIYSFFLFVSYLKHSSTMRLRYPYHFISCSFILR